MSFETFIDIDAHYHRRYLLEHILSGRNTRDYAHQLAL